MNQLLFPQKIVYSCLMICTHSYYSTSLEANIDYSEDISGNVVRVDYRSKNQTLTRGEFPVEWWAVIYNKGSYLSQSLVHTTIVYIED